MSQDLHLHVMDFGVDEHPEFGHNTLKEGDPVNSEIIKVNDDFNFVTADPGNNKENYDDPIN